MEWIKTKLSEISKPKQWKNLPGKNLLESGYTVYGANGIIGYYSSYTHEEPTIAITCRGATCGNIHITKPKSYINSNAMALDQIDESKYDLKFIYYALLVRGLKDTISGAAQPQITRTNLTRISLNIPDKLEDQKRIAQVLSNCESLIQKRKESIGLLDELLKSTFLEMFGGLNNMKYNSSSLEEFTIKITDGTHQSPTFLESGIPFLLVSNIVDNTINFNTKKFISDKEYEQLNKRTPIEFGDILFTSVGSYGKAALVKNRTKFAFQRHIAYIKPNKEKINYIYLFGAMQSDFVQVQVEKSVKGVAQKTLNLKDLKKIRIPIPPLDNQNKFANIVGKVESIKQNYKTHLQELENLYGSLIQKAFKGELDLSEVKLKLNELNS
ncbi:restriction endonuclease subunit S [Lacinutrix sp. MEBiC02595]